MRERSERQTEGERDNERDGKRQREMERGRDKRVICIVHSSSSFMAYDEGSISVFTSSISPPSFCSPLRSLHLLPSPGLGLFKCCPTHHQSVILLFDFASLVCFGLQSCRPENGILPEHRLITDKQVDAGASIQCSTASLPSQSLCLSLSLPLSPSSTSPTLSIPPLYQRL